MTSGDIAALGRLDVDEVLDIAVKEGTDDVDLVALEV
jgi:hypothetical protein